MNKTASNPRHLTSINHIWHTEGQHHV